VKARLFPRRAALLAFVTFLLGGFLSGCSLKWKNLTTEQKLEDFNYLFSIFEE
jgi:hypothetical protein